MARFFVWVRCAPVVIEGVRRKIVAIRTVRGGCAEEATRVAEVQVRQDLIRDLGSEAVGDASFEAYRVDQPGWFNWRNVESNIVLEDPDKEDKP